MDPMINLNCQTPGAATTPAQAQVPAQPDATPERPAAIASDPAGLSIVPAAAGPAFDGVAMGLVQALVASLRGPLAIVDEVGASSPLAPVLRRAGHTVTVAEESAPHQADLALALDSPFISSNILATLACQAARLRPGGALLASLPLAGGSRASLGGHELQPQQALQLVAEAGLQVLQVCLLPERRGLFVAAVRPAPCYYINNNIASVRWDGTVVGCCFDSENDNVIGHIKDYPKLGHRPLEYRLCRTCDPNWANGFAV